MAGAQADTFCLYPRVWRKPGKTPDSLYEKETNRVWDIYGAVSGTAGQGVPMYRARAQAAHETRAISSAPASKFPKAAAARAAAAETAADIAAVKALK